MCTGCPSSEKSPGSAISFTPRATASSSAVMKAK